MRPSVILRLIHAQPFRPFRVCVSDGAVYEVRHPELIQVTEEALRIHAPTVDDLGEGIATISYLHISRLEVLPTR